MFLGEWLNHTTSGLANSRIARHMRQLRKYRIVSCICRKIFYELFTLKVGVRLIHASRLSQMQLQKSQEQH